MTHRRLAAGHPVSRSSMRHPTLRTGPRLDCRSGVLRQFFRVPHGRYSHLHAFELRAVRTLGREERGQCSAVMPRGGPKCLARSEAMSRATNALSGLADQLGSQLELDPVGHEHAARSSGMFHVRFQSVRSIVRELRRSRGR